MGSLYYNGSKLKKVYYNNNQIKKLYYNNNLVFSGGELSKYTGSVSELSVARSRLVATTVGNYALFGGGFTNSLSNVSSTVDAYNTSLTKSTPNELNKGRYGLAATTVGNYALFGGGEDYNSMTIDIYDSSLTKSYTNMGTYMYDLAATTVGNYALFGGGYNGEKLATIVAFDSSLTRTAVSDFRHSRQRHDAATVGDYAIFVGGCTWYDSNGIITSIEVYDKYLTKHSAQDYDYAVESLASATVGNYAIFAGGKKIGEKRLSSDDNMEMRNRYYYLKYAVTYNSSLTKGSARSLRHKSYWLSATTLGDYALFAGGQGNDNGTDYKDNYYINTVTSYDTSLTQKELNSLYHYKYELAATTVGDYALFAGGHGATTSTPTKATSLTSIDVYQV